ncbi:MAG: GerMN domain-containing protein [Pseudomonadota bacterium]
MARRWPAVFVLVLVAFAGCGGGDSSSSGDGGTTSSAPTPTGTTTDGTTTGTTSNRVGVKVYFLRGEQLGVAAREADTLAVARAAAEALLAGPTVAERAAGLGTAIPRGTRLLGLSVANGTVTVDLSGEFDDGGGSASMLGRVAEIVATLTQFPGFERVAFRLDGEPVEAIGGEGVVVDPPIGREAIEGQTPAVLVESPAVGQTVTSPLRISGTANTYEATFQVSVTAAGGTELYRNFVTATSGNGERGTFDESLELAEGAAPGPITLTVWEDDADTGRRVNVVEIPLRLAR